MASPTSHNKRYTLRRLLCSSELHMAIIRLHFVRYHVTLNVQLRGRNGQTMNIGTVPDVRPVSDLRQNMAEITESIDTDKRPVILTKHGRGKYILLSLEEYNRIVAIGELYKAIDDGIADIEAGRVSNFGEFAKQLRKDMKNGQVHN